MIPHILETTPADFDSFLFKYKIKTYRRDQVYNWIFKKKQIDFKKMTSLSLELRELLDAEFSNFLPQIKRTEQSTDGTRKFLLKLSDNNYIEMVLIPNDKKNTLCISSQVGCMRNCAFCATAGLGLTRNLEIYEIISQVYLAIQALTEGKLTNIVFMGMGEPLDNYDNVISAVKLLQNDFCFNFSPRRITISTAGVIPGIDKLADSGLKVKLAVSLNSAIPEVRTKLMPITEKYPLPDLKISLINFRQKTSYRITFEYIMIKDVNMSKQDVKALLKFSGDISCKLNLIKWNEINELPYKSPGKDEIDAFRKSLYKSSNAVTYRQSRGQDIAAACGQLAANY